MSLEMNVSVSVSLCCVTCVNLRKCCCNADPTSQRQQADGQHLPEVPQHFASFGLQALSQLLGSGCCGNVLIRVTW